MKWATAREAEKAALSPEPVLTTLHGLAGNTLTALAEQDSAGGLYTWVNACPFCWEWRQLASWGQWLLCSNQWRQCGEMGPLWPDLPIFQEKLESGFFTRYRLMFRWNLIQVFKKLQGSQIKPPQGLGAACEPLAL